MCDVSIDTSQRKKNIEATSTKLKLSASYEFFTGFPMSTPVPFIWESPWSYFLNCCGRWGCLIRTAFSFYYFKLLLSLVNWPSQCSIDYCVNHCVLCILLGWNSPFYQQSRTAVMGQICTFGAFVHMPDVQWCNFTCLTSSLHIQHTMLKTSTCNFFWFSTLFWVMHSWRKSSAFFKLKS